MKKQTTHSKYWRFLALNIRSNSCEPPPPLSSQYLRGGELKYVSELSQLPLNITDIEMTQTYGIEHRCHFLFPVWNPHFWFCPFRRHNLWYVVNVLYVPLRYKREQSFDKMAELAASRCHRMGALPSIAPGIICSHILLSLSPTILWRGDHKGRMQEK